MAGSSITPAHPPLLESGIEKRIIIPVRYLGYIRVLLWVWLAVWGVVELALGWNLVSLLRGSGPTAPESTAPEGLLLFFFFTLAGAFLAWRLLWVIRGREILQLSSDRLILRREPQGGRPVKFNRARIRNLRVGSYAGRLIYPSWGRRFVGKENCFVAFDYEGETWEIARGVARTDADYLVSELRAP